MTTSSFSSSSSSSSSFSPSLGYLDKEQPELESSELEFGDHIVQESRHILSVLLAEVGSTGTRTDNDDNDDAGVSRTKNGNSSNRSSNSNSREPANTAASFQEGLTQAIRGTYVRTICNV